MPVRLAIALLCAALVSTTPSAQAVRPGDLLTRYAAGDRDIPWPATFDTRAFLADLTAAIDKGQAGPPAHQRRATAAFVLEAAAARLEAGDIPASRTLLEWACGRVRDHQPADTFDLAWHAAALSLIESHIDPVALEAHVQHTRGHLPQHPLLDLAWGLAAEQRASPLLVPRLPLNTTPTQLADEQARIDATVARIMDDAIERLAKAMTHPISAPDARVRTAHVRLMRREPQDALAVLTGADTGVRDAWTVYLARLFRGQALEALNRRDDAATAFRDALKVGPGGQSATLSLASLLFRHGQRDDAETLVRGLLAEADPISDPWWTYWAGSARLWNARLAALRGAIE